MTVRWITRACAAVFVAGIAGIIVTSIVNNNNGLVITLGGCTTLAAIVLIAVSAVAGRQQIDAFAEAEAEMLETQIGSLVASGTDESALRAVVRDAIRLGSR